MKSYSKHQQLGRQAIELGGKGTMLSETILQRQVEKYLDVRQLVYIHIPDKLWGALKKILPDNIFFAIAKIFGGMPDIIIFHPSGQYLAVELKVKKGKLRTGQKRWARSIKVYVARDFDVFVKLVEDWLMEMRHDKEKV